MTEARLRGKVRRRVYDTIKAYPGLHVRGVEAHLGISGPLAHYHLRRLEEAGYVEAWKEGGYVRYYPTAKGRSVTFTEEDKRTLAIVREEIPLGILLLILDEGPMAHKELPERLDVAPSTVSYHLQKLVEVGILRRGPDRRYEAVHPEKAHALLLAYNPTPSLIERFTDLWEDLYG